MLCFVSDESRPSFLLQCSVQLWQALHRCWESDVFLLPLCHRFWKLTLQLVSRYATWITELQDEVCDTLQLFVGRLLTFLQCLTGTLRCLQKEMATYIHWSVSLWRDPDDVSHCRILSPDKTEWRLISATLCGWRRCFVADQLWLMKRIQEEEEEEEVLDTVGMKSMFISGR